MRTRILRGVRDHDVAIWSGAEPFSPDNSGPGNVVAEARPTASPSDLRHGAPSDGQAGRLVHPHAATTEQPTRFQFQDYETAGGEVVDAARREAAAILAQAKQDAAAMVQTEKARVERETRAALEKKAQDTATATMRHDMESRLGSLTAALQSLHQKLDQERATLAAAWEARLKDVTLAAASAIVGRQLDLAPEISQTWLAEAVGLAVDWPEVTVRVCPDDLACLQADAASTLDRIGGGRLTFVGDPSVERGGCVLTSRHGTIEQTLAARVARLREEWGG